MTNEDEEASQGMCISPVMVAMILLVCSGVVIVSLGLVAHYRRKIYTITMHGVTSVLPDDKSTLVRSQSRRSTHASNYAKMTAKKRAGTQIQRVPEYAAAQRVSMFGFSKRRSSTSNPVEGSFDDGTYKERRVQAPLARDGTEAKANKHLWEISYKEVMVQERIGAGSFGEVYRGVWCGTTVAVKIPRSNIPPELVEAFKGKDIGDLVMSKHLQKMSDIYANFAVLKILSLANRLRKLVPTC
jgi:hypothetical protein